MTDDLPTVVSTGRVQIGEFELTVHQLSNGERVFDDNEEFRRVIAFLGIDLPQTIEGEAIEGGKADAA